MYTRVQTKVVRTTNEHVNERKKRDPSAPMSAPPADAPTESTVTVDSLVGNQPALPVHKLDTIPRPWSH